jgi:hypothetical protein
MIKPIIRLYCIVWLIPVRTSGGSVPICIFTDVLKVPAIGKPIVNQDNNQPQRDENLSIGHLWADIETFASVIMLGY